MLQLWHPLCWAAQPQGGSAHTELLWVAKPNARVRNEPPCAANSPWARARSGAEGQRRVLPTKRVDCTPELGLTLSQARSCWLSKPGPHFCTASGTAVSRFQEGGGKGSHPPAAACAVFTGHPATPPRAAPALLSPPARLLNPREQGGCPASRCCQAFPPQQTGTRQLPEGFPGAEHTGPVGNSNRQLPAQPWHRDPPRVRELLPALGRAINTFEHTLHCAGWTPRCPLSPMFNSLGKASPAQAPWPQPNQSAQCHDSTSPWPWRDPTPARSCGLGSHRTGAGSSELTNPDGLSVGKAERSTDQPL